MGGDFSLKTHNGFMSWWTGGATGDATTAQEMIAHMMKLGDGLMEFTNSIDKMSRNLMRYQTEDFFKDADTHFNGGLGIVGMALNGYNKLPNAVKRQYAYKLSNVLPFKSGKIFQGVKAFSKSAGKVAGRLGVVGTILTAGVTAQEFISGEWDAHTVVNASLLVGTAAATVFSAPAVLTGIAIYGIADYAFGIGDKLDENFGRESTFWYP